MWHRGETSFVNWTFFGYFLLRDNPSGKTTFYLTHPLLTHPYMIPISFVWHQHVQYFQFCFPPSIFHLSVEWDRLKSQTCVYLCSACCHASDTQSSWTSPRTEYIIDYSYVLWRGTECDSGHIHCAFGTGLVSATFWHGHCVVWNILKKAWLSPVYTNAQSRPILSLPQKPSTSFP